MTETCWLLNGECVTVPPEGYYGFIYKVIDDKGRIYVGKKAFAHKRKTKLSKKARAGTRKRVKVEHVDSQWLKYWGSCKPLLEYISNRPMLTTGFRREILKLCETKQSLSYWEMAIMVQERVLFRDDCWNGCIMSRFYRGKIHQ